MLVWLLRHDGYGNSSGPFTLENTEVAIAACKILTVKDISDALSFGFYSE